MVQDGKRKTRGTDKKKDMWRKRTVGEEKEEEGRGE